MCSGRVDLEFILRALSNGMDGVFVGACRLGECNYITHGNYHALNKVLLCKKIMEHIGFNPERLRIAFMSSGEGMVFVDEVNAFVNSIRHLGPLGTAEGLSEQAVKVRLEAVKHITPYLRLVETERLGVRFDTVEEYQDFYASEEFTRVFDEVIADKLAISQIMVLLKEKPLSTGEFAEIMGMNPSDVSRHLTNSAKLGFIRFNAEEKHFTRA